MKIKCINCGLFIDTPQSILTFFEPLSKSSYYVKKLFVKKEFICPNCDHEHLKEDIVETDIVWGEAILEEIHEDFLLVVQGEDETFIAMKQKFSSNSPRTPLSGPNLAHLLRVMNIEITQIDTGNGDTCIDSYNVNGTLDGTTTIGNNNENKSDFAHDDKKLKVAVIGNGIIVKNK